MCCVAKSSVLKYVKVNVVLAVFIMIVVPHMFCHIGVHLITRFQFLISVDPLITTGENGFSRSWLNNKSA